MFPVFSVKCQWFLLQMMGPTGSICPIYALVVNLMNYTFLLKFSQFESVSYEKGFGFYPASIGKLMFVFQLFQGIKGIIL